jgi:hypothetical protein
MRVPFAGESVRAIQMAIPFTFGGLPYRSGSWIVIGNGWRDAYLPESFVARFGCLRGAA